MLVEADIDMTPELLAKAFCELSDEEQADFFVHAAKIAERWRNPRVQWVAIGSHLGTCECSTPEARMMVRSITDGLMDALELGGTDGEEEQDRAG